MPDQSPPGQHLVSWYAYPALEDLHLAASEITLNIPGHAPVVATLERFEHRSGYIDLGIVADNSDFIVDPEAGPEDMSWRWEGKAQGWVVALTLHQGVLAGRITGPVHRYELAPSPNGQTVLGMVNPDWWSTHGDEAESSEPLLAQLDAMQRADSAAAQAPESQSPDYCSVPVPTQTQVIDVGIVIDPTAVSWYGSVAAVTAMAQAAIDDTNLVLANSGVGTVRVRMGTPVLAGQTFPEFIADALDEFTGVSPIGVYPWLDVDPNHTMETLRDQGGYDVLALARRDQNSACGMARAQRWVLNNGYPQEPGPSYARLAYLVFDPGCNADRLNLAHELGHTLGMEHDPANAPTTPGWSPSCAWSHAHRVGPLGESGSQSVPERFRFRTVMSYYTHGANPSAGPPSCRLQGSGVSLDTLCPLIDAFGTPDLEWAGWSGSGGGPFGLQPVGTVPGAHRIGADPPSVPSHKKAHGADTVARLGPVVAQFRTLDPIMSDGFE